MTKKTGFLLFAVLCLLVGSYPIIFYLILHEEFNLLPAKPSFLHTNLFWHIGFYTHVISGGIALFIGWSQFIAAFRNRFPSIHRLIGKIYVASAFISSVAAIGIGFYASGGWIAAAGFISLGIIWLYTTILAYSAILNKKILEHQKWMIFSFAACFAGVTLRLWLPVLINTFNDFLPAYRIVAWLCWVPNLAIAYLITKKGKL